MWRFQWVLSVASYAAPRRVTDGYQKINIRNRANIWEANSRSILSRAVNLTIGIALVMLSINEWLCGSVRSVVHVANKNDGKFGASGRRTGTGYQNFYMGIDDKDVGGAGSRAKSRAGPRVILYAENVQR